MVLDESSVPKGGTSSSTTTTTIPVMTGSITATTTTPTTAIIISSNRYLSRVLFSNHAQLYWNALIDMLHSRSLFSDQYRMIQIWKKIPKDIQPKVLDEMDKARQSYNEFDFHGMLLTFSVMRTNATSNMDQLDRFIHYLEHICSTRYPGEDYYMRRNLLALFYNTRGLSYSEMEKYEMSIKDFETALSLMPNYTVAMNNMGCALFHQREYAGAKDKFSKAAQLLPNSEYFFNLGTTAKLQGLYDEAIELYTRAINKEPTHLGAVYHRAESLSRMKRNDEALMDLNRAIELEPNFCSAWESRASIHEKMGKYVAALQDLSKSRQSTTRYNTILHILQRQSGHDMLMLE